MIDSMTTPIRMPDDGAPAPGDPVSDPEKIRVLIVDDHAVVRSGLRVFLDLQADI